MSPPPWHWSNLMLKGGFFTTVWKCVHAMATLRSVNVNVFRPSMLSKIFDAVKN